MARGYYSTESIVSTTTVSQSRSQLTLPQHGSLAVSARGEVPCSTASNPCWKERAVNETTSSAVGGRKSIRLCFIRQ